MSEHVYKMLELTGSSPASIEDAVKNAIAKAAKTVRRMPDRADGPLCGHAARAERCAVNLILQRKAHLHRDLDLLPRPYFELQLHVYCSSGGCGMRLKKLRIENFRSIQTLEIELQRVCAIIGPNNSGKSNSRSAAAGTSSGVGPRASHFTEDDDYLRDPDRDIHIECAFEPSLEYRKLKDGDPVQIETLRYIYDRYKIGQQAGTRKLDHSCLPDT